MPGFCVTQWLVHKFIFSSKKWWANNWLVSEPFRKKENESLVPGKGCRSIAVYLGASRSRDHPLTEMTGAQAGSKINEAEKRKPGVAAKALV